jgi:hypothetical protein
MLEVLGPAGLKIGRCGFRGFLLLLWGLGVRLFFSSFSCFSVEVSSCILLVYLGAPYAFL